MTIQQFDTTDLAAMQVNIEHIKKTLDRIEGKVDRVNGRLRVTEQSVAVLENEQENIKHQQRKNDVIGTALSLVAAVGAAIWGTNR